MTPASSDRDRALAAYRRADAAGDAQAATDLGVLLERQGDLEGALAAYKRGDERGDVNGAFNLGCLLAEMGDIAGALAALRRADERGDATGSSNLGVLLERQGDLDGALAAYRRADERGDANGAFNLGLLLTARGDTAGARGAYRRAAERGVRQAREPFARAEAEAAPADVNSPASGEPRAQMSPQPAVVEVDPAPDTAVNPASEVASDPLVPDANPVARDNGGESAGRQWIGQTSRRRWVTAVCVLALLGVTAAVAWRGLRRFS